MTSGGNSSNLNRSPSVRETRIEQRRNYTDACVERGADGDGIRRGTNRIYNELFGSKPSGSRDDWTDRQQQEITIAEDFAANHVRSLPTPAAGSNQTSANHRVVEQSGEAARVAREYCDDQSENGNFYTRIYSASHPKIIGDTFEPTKLRSQPERQYTGSFSNDLKRCGWIIVGVLGWLLLHKLLVR